MTAESERPGRAVPRAIRWILGVQIVILGYGGVVHVIQVATGGWPPYAWAPGWLAAYFTSLTLLDPLAAGLLWFRRAAGLHLSAFVFVTDAAANAYATYGLLQASGTAMIAQAAITAIAIGVLVTARHVRPWLR